MSKSSETSGISEARVTRRGFIKAGLAAAGVAGLVACSKEAAATNGTPTEQQTETSGNPTPSAETTTPQPESTPTPEVQYPEKSAEALAMQDMALEDFLSLSDKEKRFWYWTILSQYKNSADLENGEAGLLPFVIYNSGKGKLIDRSADNPLDISATTDASPANIIKGLYFAMSTCYASQDISHFDYVDGGWHQGNGPKTLDSMCVGPRENVLFYNGNMSQLQGSEGRYMYSEEPTDCELIEKSSIDIDGVSCITKKIKFNSTSYSFDNESRAQNGICWTAAFIPAEGDVPGMWSLVAAEYDPPAA